MSMSNEMTFVERHLTRDEKYDRRWMLEYALENAKKALPGAGGGNRKWIEGEVRKLEAALKKIDNGKTDDDDVRFPYEMSIGEVTAALRRLESPDVFGNPEIRHPMYKKALLARRAELRKRGER